MNGKEQKATQTRASEEVIASEESTGVVVKSELLNQVMTRCSTSLIYEFLSEQPANLTDQSHEPKQVTIHGTTALYGVLVGVGGQRACGVIIELDDGSSITADASQELTKAAAALLYQQVAVRGSATWDRQSRKLLRLVADSIEAVNTSSSHEKLAAFAESIAPDLESGKLEAHLKEYREAE